jgi:hypothetical protein
MHYWSLRPSKFEQLIQVIILVFFLWLYYEYYSFVHVRIVIIIAFFLALTTYFSSGHITSMENILGKWVLHHSKKKQIELSSFAILLDTKYAIVLLAKHFYKKKSNIIVIYSDQFKYEDEAYFRFLIKTMKKNS